MIVSFVQKTASDPLCNVSLFIKPKSKYREKVASGVVEGRSFVKLIDNIILALGTWFSLSCINVA